MIIEKLKKLVIANWKMNMSYKDSYEFLEKLTNAKSNNVEIIILPSLLHTKSLIDKFPSVNFGVQNITHLSDKSGAFTGEVSSSQAREIGAKFVLCGHSERRNFFEENNKITSEKIKYILNDELIPIICIGENVKARMMGTTNSSLKSQIKACLPETDKKIIIAYEPIWAIGTGKMPPKNYIEDTCGFLNEHLSSVAKNARLVYGGSVDAKASEWLSSCNYIDGVLIGSSSTMINEFIKIIKSYD